MFVTEITDFVGLVLVLPDGSKVKIRLHEKQKGKRRSRLVLEAPKEVKIERENL